MNCDYYAVYNIIVLSRDAICTLVPRRVRRLRQSLSLLTAFHRTTNVSARLTFLSDIPWSAHVYQPTTPTLVYSERPTWTVFSHTAHVRPAELALLRRTRLSTYYSRYAGTEHTLSRRPAPRTTARSYLFIVDHFVAPCRSPSHIFYIENAAYLLICPNLSY